MSHHRALRDATEILPTGRQSGTWNGSYVHSKARCLE